MTQSRGTSCFSVFIVIAIEHSKPHAPVLGKDGFPENCKGHQLTMGICYHETLIRNMLSFIVSTPSVFTIIDTWGT
jgi:hypothetical protein